MYYILKFNKLIEIGIKKKTRKKSKEANNILVGMNLIESVMLQQINNIFF